MALVGPLLFGSAIAIALFVSLGGDVGRADGEPMRMHDWVYVTAAFVFAVLCAFNLITALVRVITRAVR